MRQIYHSRFIVVGKRTIHLSGFRLCININIGERAKSDKCEWGGESEPQGRLNARIRMCMCVRVCEGGRGEDGQERDDVQPRTQPFASSVASPSRHPPRPALGDRLNRAPSSCALSSPRPATRPSSGALDDIRRRPVTLGIRSAPFPSPARSSAPYVLTYKRIP